MDVATQPLGAFIAPCTRRRRATRARRGRAPVRLRRAGCGSGRAAPAARAPSRSLRRASARPAERAAVDRRTAPRSPRRKPRRVPTPTPMPTVAVDELGQAFGAARDDRRAAGHRLEHRQAEGLLVAGVHEGVGAGERGRELVGVGDERQHADALAARRRRRPGADREQQVRRAEPLDRVGQHVEVLLGGEAAGVDEHARRRRPARALAPARARRATGGRSRVSTPSGWQATRSTPQSTRWRRMLAARREHEVEAGGRRGAHSARAARAAACAEALAGGQPRHRLEVRVAVGDGGDAARARRVDARPGDAVRVAGLDQVGRERGQHARDRARAAAAAGSRRCRQRQRRQAGSPSRRRRPRVGTAIVWRQPACPASQACLVSR